MFDIRRREFITLLGGAPAAWPLAARAEQPATPVIGFLSPAPAAGDIPHLIAAFRRGLAEAGYVEGKNLAIEYRFNNFRPELMTEAAGDLVRLKMSVIFASVPEAVVAVRNATSSISYRCAGFGERSSCQGICQESCAPGRQYDGNVS